MFLQLLTYLLKLLCINIANGIRYTNVKSAISFYNILCDHHMITEWSNTTVWETLSRSYGCEAYVLAYVSTIMYIIIKGTVNHKSPQTQHFPFDLNNWITRVQSYHQFRLEFYNMKSKIQSQSLGFFRIQESESVQVKIGVLTPTVANFKNITGN